MTNNVLILGGGLTGLVVGEKLQRNGFNVTIVEKDNDLGGMCRTKIHHAAWANYHYDLGPHKFATRQEEAQKYYDLKMSENSKISVVIKSRINMYGKWFAYPIRIFEILKKFPYHGFRCGVDFMLSHLKGDGYTYESYLKGRMGNYTYNFVFKDFAEKIWGASYVLDKKLAETRVITPTIIDIIKGILFGDKTTFKKFSYPKNGMGDFLRNIEESFDHSGGTIYLNSVLRSYNDGNVIIRTPDEDIKLRDCIVISTIKPQDICIPMAIEYDDQLKYRDIHLFYYLVPKGKIEDTWDFFTSSDICFNRVSRNFSPYMSDLEHDIVCVEATSYEGRSVSQDDITSDFCKVYDVSINDMWVDKIDGAYPIYNLGYKETINKLLDKIEHDGRIFCIGRHACHNYNNIDHCIVEALDLANIIISGGTNKDWKEKREKYNWVIVD